MSSAHDAHAAPAHAHDDHDAFDGEPAKELSPGEPRSPSWLPAVGLVLFSLAGVYMLSGGDGPTSSLAAPRPLPVEPATNAAAVAPQPQRNPAANAPQFPAPPSRPEAAPSPSGSAGVRKLTKEQVDELKKKIGDARAKGLVPTRPAQGNPHK
ncbi:MAG: hypothetical protein QM820_49480 [Minicystis sp.]